MQRPTIPPPNLLRAPSTAFKNTAHPYPYTNSTYFYGSHYVQAYHPQPVFQSGPSSLAHTSGSSSSNGSNIPVHLMSTWYQPGRNRCSHPGCKFIGSHRSVEIHMMDRHLIFPPGWDTKKKSEWDADPTLKGKPIPIQGTNVVLDTPELIDAWIAERKKRFPSAARVEDKKRKVEEAVARGQLDLTNTRRTKRQKAENALREAPKRKLPRQSSLDNIKQELSKSSFQQRFGKAQVPPPNQNVDPEAKPILGEDSDDDDGTPEELPSKLHDPEEMVPGRVPPLPAPGQYPPTRRPQPRRPPRNPFASRPTLLRNLLLPEIRMTVSNLSQAIRFLVDNDFLHNVELRPGQAEEQQPKIHILGSQEL